MRIEKLQLKNFKRFTDLTLEGIPASAKLVMLIGANGSGKTSVFDAFNWLSSLVRSGRGLDDKAYFGKSLDKPIAVRANFAGGNWYKRENDGSFGNFELDMKFIGRSSLRTDARH